MCDLYYEETFTHDGAEFRARYFYDTDMGAPWDKEGGHGPVSGWKHHALGQGTKPPKAPGELILLWDRGSYRTYDFQEACRIARRDGWDAPPYKTGTARERAARAALADYKRLRAWCNDEWHWCGIVVDIPDTPYEASLWGIESDAGDYFTEVKADLAEECLDQIAAQGRAA